DSNSCVHDPKGGSNEPLATSSALVAVVLVVLAIPAVVAAHTAAPRHTCCQWIANRCLESTAENVNQREDRMNRISPRRLVALAVTVASLAIPGVVAALTAAPCHTGCY